MREGAVQLKYACAVAHFPFPHCEVCEHSRGPSHPPRNGSCCRGSRDPQGGPGGERSRLFLPTTTKPHVLNLCCPLVTNHEATEEDSLEQSLPPPRSSDPKAATVRGRGCNRAWQRLQPSAAEAATVRGRGCNRAMNGGAARGGNAERLAIAEAAPAAEHLEVERLGYLRLWLLAGTGGAARRRKRLEHQRQSHSLPRRCRSDLLSPGRLRVLTIWRPLASERPAERSGALGHWTTGRIAKARPSGRGGGCRG